MLRDCVSKDTAANELLLVRAGRCARVVVEGRDRVGQAVLPVYSTIIDAGEVGLEEVLEDRSCSWMIAALGVGIGEDCDLSRMRYGKVVVLVDDSPVGRRVAARVESFLERFMPGLVESGRVVRRAFPER